MSTTVSRTGELSPVQYLEQQFEMGRVRNDCWAREIIDLMDDHGPDHCLDCPDGGATEDGMWWKPPGEDWYTEAEDDFVAAWAKYPEPPLPEPASHFALGPEYPTRMA